MTRSRLIAVFAVTLAFVALPPAASAYSGHASKGSRAAAQVRGASKAVRLIPKKSWARGKRSALLHQAALALKQLHRRKTCAALSRSESFRGGLRDARTWKHGKPPRKRLKRPLKLLGAAGKGLLKKAGRRCAVPQKVSRGERRHHGEPLGQRVTPPPGSPEQGGDEEEERKKRDLEQGKLKLPKSRPQAQVEPDPHQPEAARVSLIAHAAADPFTYFRSTDVGAAIGGAVPMEPTAAVAGDIAWYTANTGVGLSTNGGRTFTLFNPSNVLPDNGLAFCCDQLVSYDRKNRLFVWISQYWCPAADQRCTTTGGNRIRIATAHPEDLERNAATPNLAWTWWDITPKDFGVKDKDAWFDRSDMGVDDWYVNWTVDVMRGGKVRSVLARYPLQALAKAPRELHWFYQTDGGARYQVAQGTHDGTIFVNAKSQSQFSAFSWERAADKLFRHDLDHSTVPEYNVGATGADGANWLARQAIFPGSPDAATVADDALYVATTTGRAVCTSKCDGATPVLKQIYPHPAVAITAYDVNTFKLIDEDAIWRNDTAYALPALSTDRAGDVGIGMRAAAAGANPAPVAGFLTPTKELSLALAAVGDPQVGDYYSIRPGRTKRSFAMTGESVDAAGAYHWNYFEFGYGPSPYVSPPTVSITSPNELDVIGVGEALTFGASASDPVDGKLPGSAYRWTYDGKPFAGTGDTVSLIENNPGVHTMTVTVANADGATASDTVHVRVKAPTLPGHPIVHITFPLDGSSYCTNAADGGGDYVTAGMTATATDPSMPPGPLTYVWTDSIDGGARQTVATTLSPALKLYLRAGDLRTTHDLQLTATNATGPTSDDVRIEVKDPSLCVR